MTRIGILSDTHGLIRPEVEVFMKSCDYVIHAGDVGNAETLNKLRSMNNITIVQGNIDKGYCAEGLPITEFLRIKGYYFCIIHEIEKIDIDPQSAGFHFVIYGHSHKPEHKNVKGIHYINPGSAGPGRFNLPISYALIELRGKVPRIYFYRI